MESLLLLYTFLYGLFDISSASVLTIPSLVGMKGTKVTLECTYKSSERWYVIQWKRQYTKTDVVTITTLTNTGKVALMPIFEDNMDQEFRDRARTSVNMDVGSIDFKLFIHDFSCNDTGKYICDVTGPKTASNTTELTITAKPSAPNVLDDEVLLEMNGTYTLMCSAMAGIPAADLRWYFKLPESDNFIKVETETKQQENKQLSECSYKATQLIDVSVNKETDGIIYRCQVESALLTQAENDSFYDDVLIKIPIPEKEYLLPSTKLPDDINKGTRVGGAVPSIVTFLSIAIFGLCS